jgi:hypothetical protein
MLPVAADLSLAPCFFDEPSRQSARFKRHLTGKYASAVPRSAFLVVIVQVIACDAVAAREINLPADASCYAAAHIPPVQKSHLNKTPNFKQQKKRREDLQKKRNEEKQRQQAARKTSVFQPEKS